MKAHCGGGLFVVMSCLWKARKSNFVFNIILCWSRIQYQMDGLLCGNNRWISVYLVMLLTFFRLLRLISNQDRDDMRGTSHNSLDNLYSL